MCADREEPADRILENLEDAERLSRYYGILSDRNQRVHLILSLTTILLSVGAGVTLLTKPSRYISRPRVYACGIGYCDHAGVRSLAESHDSTAG